MPPYVSYQLSWKNEAYYTGGRLTNTSCGSAVKVLKVDTGTVEKKIEEVKVHCIAM